MKTVKNFEALFLVLAASATFATFATCAMADVPHATMKQAAAVPVSAPMQVVVIHGQRLSAAQKGAL